MPIWGRAPQESEGSKPRRRCLIASLSSAYWCVVTCKLYLRLFTNTCHMVAPSMYVSWMCLCLHQIIPPCCKPVALFMHGMESDPPCIQHASPSVLQVSNPGRQVDQPLLIGIMIHVPRAATRAWTLLPAVPFLRLWARCTILCLIKRISGQGGSFSIVARFKHLID